MSDLNRPLKDRHT